MADFSIPTLPQITPPPQMSLGDMVNTARAAQAYQQAALVNPLDLQARQMAVEQSSKLNPLAFQQQTAQTQTAQQQAASGKIGLDIDTQKNNERLQLQQFFSNPDNFQTNGQMDLGKINAQVPKIAPLTGPDYIKHISDLSTAQTAAQKASVGLNQDNRNLISSVLGIMGRSGNEDPQKVIDEMRLLVNQNPDNKYLKSLVEDAYVPIFKKMPAGPNVADASTKAAQAILTPAQQQEAFTSTAGTLNTGANVLQTINKPSIGNAPPTIKVGKSLAQVQLSPGQRMTDTGQKDLNNNSIFNVLDANGRVIGQTTVPAGVSENQMPGAGGVSQPRPQQPIIDQTTGSTLNPVKQSAVQPNVPATNAPVRIPPGESADRVTFAQNLRTTAMQAASQVPMQQFNNNQIIKLADQVVGGKGAETFAALTGGYAALPFGSDNASNLNQLGHYMALQTSSLAQSSGLGQTAGAVNTTNQIAGTTEWTPEAIKNTARVNRALTTATDLFNKGITAAFKVSNNPMSSIDFQNNWINTLGSDGIEAIRLYDAMKNNDKLGIKQVVDSAGGPDSPKYKSLIAKLGQINQLIKGQ